MKALFKICFLGLIISYFGCQQGIASEIKVDSSNATTYTSAVEINEVLCGYAETTVYAMTMDGKEMKMVVGQDNSEIQGLTIHHRIQS